MPGRNVLPSPVTGADRKNARSCDALHSRPSVESAHCAFAVCRTGWHIPSMVSETALCLPSHCSMAWVDEFARSPEPAFSAVCMIGLTGSSCFAVQPANCRSSSGRAKQNIMQVRFNLFTSKHQCNPGRKVAPSPVTLLPLKNCCVAASLAAWRWMT